MKKLIILCLVSICSTIHVQAQLHKTSLPKEDFALKSKHQKTAAWILLGGGAVLTTTGLAITSNKIWEDIIEGRDRPRGEGAFYTGIVMMGASIPFFILSRKNAKKASLAFSNERIYKLQTGFVVHRNVPSIKIKITLP